MGDLGRSLQSQKKVGRFSFSPNLFSLSVRDYFTFHAWGRSRLRAQIFNGDLD